MTKHRIQTPQAKRLREQGLAHATAHALSGLARKVYAEQAGISVYKLDYWRTLAMRLGTLTDTPVLSSIPLPTKTTASPALFVEISRAAHKAPVSAELNAPTANPRLATPTIELHLGGLWQGHHLSLPANIESRWLASLLEALPTQTTGCDRPAPQRITTVRQTTQKQVPS